MLSLLRKRERVTVLGLGTIRVSSRTDLDRGVVTYRVSGPAGLSGSFTVQHVSDVEYRQRHGYRARVSFGRFLDGRFGPGRAVDCLTVDGETFIGARLVDTGVMFASFDDGRRVRGRRLRTEDLGYDESPTTCAMVLVLDAVLRRWLQHKDAELLWRAVAAPVARLKLLALTTEFAKRQAESWELLRWLDDTNERIEHLRRIAGI